MMVSILNNHVSEVVPFLKFGHMIIATIFCTFHRNMQFVVMLYIIVDLPASYNYIKH